MTETLPVENQGLPPALADLKIELSVRVGTSELSLDDVTRLTQGSIITLRESAERPLDLCANGRVIARGQLEETDDGEGIALRITETCSRRG
ncbi:MAG: FliM/FliN family flagellar motor switch protein [Parvularculaceae bacterium]|nr:FliM/FliN family flagellar motor switch protein [Parvularculaceae bacterium]